MNSLETNNRSAISELDQNLEFLRQTYLFAVVPLESLKVFAYLCTREKFKQGEYLIHQGEDDGQALYIINGKATLERSDNKRTTEIRNCEDGEFIGGLTLLGEKRRLFSLRSLTDTTCLVLNREKFSKTMEQFPNLMFKICNAVAQSVDTWEERFLAERADECGQCVGRLGVTLI